MKHMHTTVKATATTASLPAWFGHATWFIHVLADDPRAADGLPVVDMDAVHREDGESDVQ